MKERSTIRWKNAVTSFRVLPRLPPFVPSFPINYGNRVAIKILKRAGRDKNNLV